MEKVIYGLWRTPDRDVSEVAQVVLDTVAPAVLDVGVAGLRVNLEAPEATAMRWGSADDGALLTGAVGVWLDSIDGRPPVEEALAGTGCTIHGFLVTESVPLPYASIDWRLGEASPGVSLLTLFPKRDGLTDDEFFAVWHGEQTPMSFELHPITLYMRNTVARPLTAGAPPFRGIVEETVPSLDDLLDLHRFYGSGGDQAELDRRMTASAALHDRFTTMDGLEMVPCREHLFKVLST